jgi:hypothetical protein
VWRLEFQIRREGMTSFRLAPDVSIGDDSEDLTDLEAHIEAELSAEELPQLATFPKLFAHRDAFFQHLTAHWLRFTQPGNGKVPSRWPTDPTWETLRREFGRLASVPPLHEQEVVKALEVQDASVASASLRQLATLADLIATREAERLKSRKAAVAEREGMVPPWVEEGMGTSTERTERVRHLIQMLLGIFAAHGVLALGDKPAHSVGDLLTQHLELLEAETEEKGGIGIVLRDHFARVYKRALPLELVAAPS